MRILALETSHQPGQIAFLVGDKILQSHSLPVGQRTTQTFAQQIRLGLAEVGWQVKDVELFAVCEGPGSFTGLRIGVTAAKTFAYATGAAVASVNTLDVLAAQALATCDDGASQMPQMPAQFWATLDAQRQQLFVARYTPAASDRRLAERQSDVEIVDAVAWLKQLPHQSIVTGSGLQTPAVRNQIPSNCRPTPASAWTANAGSLGQVAWHQSQCGEAQSLWNLTARYYRRSAAEEKAMNQNDAR